MAIAVLPDGSKRELPDGSTVMQLAESIGRGLAKAAVVGKVDDRVVDLSYALTGEHKVSIVTERDPQALTVFAPQHRPRDGRGDPAALAAKQARVWAAAG